MFLKVYSEVFKQEIVISYFVDYAFYSRSYDVSFFRALARNSVMLIVQNFRLMNILRNQNC